MSDSETPSVLPTLTQPFPTVADGPPFFTRSIGDLPLSSCDPKDAPIENYCERWAVPMVTQWEAPTQCPGIVPQDQQEDWYLECGPDAFEQVWFNDGYYSPGVCPSGYTIDCTATESYLNSETLMPEETAGLCVPIGYRCDPGTADEDSQIVFWAARTTTLGSESLTASRPAIQVRWREGDLIYLPVHPLDVPTSATPASVPTSDFSDRSATRPGHGDNTNGTPSASSTSSGGSSETGAANGGSSGDSSLSTGAIAGIVVGVVGALALLGVGIWICLARRKKQAPQSVAQSDPSMVQYVGGPPMQGDGAMHQYQYHHQPQQQQQHSPYIPGAVTSYYDKPQYMAQTNLAPAYPQEVEGSPAMGSVAPASTSPAPAEMHSPPQPYNYAPPGLVLGNDLEVASSNSPMDQRSAHGLGVEQGEVWERQQLLQRQTALQERRAMLEMEQIAREEMAIQQRLSQMPPR